LGRNLRQLSTCVFFDGCRVKSSSVNMCTLVSSSWWFRRLKAFHHTSISKIVHSSISASLFARNAVNTFLKLKRHLLEYCSKVGGATSFGGNVITSQTSRRPRPSSALNHNEVVLKIVHMEEKLLHLMCPSPRPVVKQLEF